MGVVATVRTSQKGVAALQALLAQVPECHHAFMTCVFRDLPDGYVLTPKGILRGEQGDRGQVFCSPFRPKLRTATPDGKGWATVIEILNPAGSVVECHLPWKMLHGKKAEAIGWLADHGLRNYGRFGSDDVLELIKHWDVGVHLTAIDRVGWTEGLDAFVLPSGRILVREGASEQYRFTGKEFGKEKGDLDAWRSGVGLLARGNPNLLFGCSLAFSAPLLAFLPASDSVIYHMYGDTSGGKSTTLSASLTVWPRTGKKPKSWTATDNGLEAEFARATHILLGLDELPKKPSLEFGNAVYRLVNGVGKGRAEKGGSSKDRQAWQTAVLSTGEHSSAAVLKALEGEQHGGQSVRMLDIPMVGAHGAFDDLHGHQTSAAFLRLLVRRIDEAAGPAGAAFVSTLLRQEGTEKRLASEIETQAAALQEHLGIAPDDPEANRIQRVLDNLAIVAVAGEWATEFGITGWDPGEASGAVRAIAQRWRESPKVEMPDDPTEAVRRTRDALRRDGERYMDLSVGKDSRAMPTDLAGFQDTKYFYVLTPAFQQMHPTCNVRDMARLLQEAKFLEPGGVKGSLQYKTKEIGGQRRNTYRIQRLILDA